jgi:hypothetical protein
MTPCFTRKSNTADCTIIAPSTNSSVSLLSLAILTSLRMPAMFWQDAITIPKGAEASKHVFPNPGRAIYFRPSSFDDAVISVDSPRLWHQCDLANDGLSHSSRWG